MADSASKRYFLRKTQRLTKNDEFRAVLARKCFYKNDLIQIYAAKNSLNKPRLGVSVSRKIGNSTKRNRVKRLTREVFRLHQHDIPPDYDYLLIFSPKMSKKPVSDECMLYDKISFNMLKKAFLESAKHIDKAETQK